VSRRRRPPRRVSAKEVRRALLVFAEGALTEERYLNHYRRLHRRTVSVEIADLHAMPLTMVEAAVAAKQKNERLARRGKGSAHDEVWCVFDVDTHPHLAAATQLAQANGIKLAISCPCIELWFLLHFAEQSAHLESPEAQTAAKTELECGKGLSEAALAALEANYEQAKARARALEAKHRGDGTPDPANPSSGVWRIIDSISAPPS
jgi:hypothetical protein